VAPSRVLINAFFLQQDEIFDMVHPADPFRITLEDLKSCKQGHTIVFMLVDCNAFWQYDNVSAALPMVLSRGWWIAVNCWLCSSEGIVDAAKRRGRS
jgi:hypothetical protein